MDAVEKDDFIHALGQTMEFFGKELDKQQAAFWYQACKDKPATKLKAALLEYIKIGKFAPRPAQILELVSQNAEHARSALPAPPDDPVRCPDDIHNAWVWFIGTYTKGSNMDGLFEAPDIPLETQEHYLMIVNREAKRTNQPDAIPDEFKLKEVWGNL